MIHSYKYSEIHEDKPTLTELIIKNWGSSQMVSRGHIHQIDQLPGYICTLKDTRDIIGLLTYQIKDEQMEIVSLDSLKEGKGIGSNLVRLAIKKAKELDLKRIWLITSNDNWHAMSFYRKLGFTMTAVYPNAITEARKIKPEIPLINEENGIAITDEVEFSLVES
ncbi:GNAT family N-acetyltransferase [Brevibacillus daliensis]|uniref:GNAT family N-acetyltransferase n=1 Tax=Brevibacillus daliensis TaxID=2892995 RepID=UPI001E467200|nr:GNAT family N-acetyltransferase [Brevibacillus daliensis]